jgi:hypothetical protein
MKTLLPDNPLTFLQRCVREGRIFWTYHVNMRLKGRYISRESIIESWPGYEIIESYPTDKYLPSYLVYAEYQGKPFHILLAADVDGDNVRIVTAYYPAADEWEEDFKRRRVLA